MQLTSLATLDWSQMAAVFNTVYEGYIMPVTWTPESIQHHLCINDADLAHSPLWLDGAGAVIGAAALGVRGDRGWVGAFGLAPAARGQGLSGRLMQHVLANGHQRGLRQIQLEVLEANKAAIAAYEKAGYVHPRNLRLFTRPADLAPPAVACDHVQPAAVPDLLAHAFVLRTTPPCWQREPASLAAIEDLQALAVGPAGQPEGYVMFRINASEIRLADLCAARSDHVPALTAALARAYPGRSMRLLNEPAESPICAALDACGWQEFVRQREMFIALHNEPGIKLPAQGLALQ